MKKVFNFFTRPEEDGNSVGTYRPKEPTLRPAPTVHPQPAQPGQPGLNRYTGGGARPVRPASPPEPAPAAVGEMQEETTMPATKPAAGQQALPTAYAELVAYFNRTVAERKSPYNSLVGAAERLKEFIPNETARLQAALAICGDRWTPDALSLAISAHISDIELARKRAHESTHQLDAERAATLRAEARGIEDHNARLRAEKQELEEKLSGLEAAMRANDEKIAALEAQIEAAEHGTGSTGFVDQAAENLKNDLLAKKVILGLP